MKKTLLLSLILFLLNCENSDNLSNPEASDHYLLDEVEFTTVEIPGKTMFTGINDSTTEYAATFRISETEVTYKLWTYVYQNCGSYMGYDMDSGLNGDGSSSETEQPVTKISWKDAIVWTNALTECYNLNNNTSYTCVYRNNSGCIRSVHDTQILNPIVDTDSQGFRLLTSNEWELAARYIGDTNGDGDILDAGEYLYGNSTSGGVTSISGKSVKNRNPNSAGIYDMSGNVWEWVFNPYNSDFKTVRGGAWASSGESLQLGFTGGNDPDRADKYIGLRIGQTP